jgi:hypothetical protein
MPLIAATEHLTVEVRTGGDDGLTQRLADQLRATFAAAPTYIAGTLAKRLIITIPTHVEWRKIDGKTWITYRLEIASGPKSIQSSGSCWEAGMSLCANQIVKAAAVFKRDDSSDRQSETFR